VNLLLKELNEYLALRRGLGFKLRGHESVLRKFVVFLQARSVEFVTTGLALEWAQQPQQASPAHRARRLGMARDFAQYLSARDPRTQVPPRDLLPGKARRAQPYIYSDAQILRLVQAAARLKPRDGIRPRTYGTLFGLLAVTGMRLGEVVGLKDPDVDLREGLLTVRQSKFNKTRILPVHSSTQETLRAYARERDRLVPGRATDRFFVSNRGTGLNHSIVRHAFIHLSRHVGLRTPADRHGPRMHDLRHTFAVRTLTDWHRAGIDPEQRLPLLSAYLGHAKVSDTYWYLTAVPELMGAVNTRLEHLLGDLS
jgi:integrase/recombinase XerD